MKTLLRSVWVLLLIVAILGCSDDDNNPVAPADTMSTLVIGDVVLRPYVDFLANIHPIYGQENEVDSVFFGDSLCRMEVGMPFNIYGTTYLYGLSYFNTDDERYTSGDTVEIDFYEGNELTTAYVKLLALETDSVDVVLPTEDSVIALSDPIEIHWHPVPNADWYGLGLWYIGDQPQTDYYDQNNISTTDTTYTVDASELIVNGDFIIYVTAVSGPVPGVEDPNIDGSTLTGTIYSRSALTIIHVRAGTPGPKLVVEDMTLSADDRDAQARAMIEAIYNSK